MEFKPAFENIENKLDRKGKQISFAKERLTAVSNYVYSLLSNEEDTVHLSVYGDTKAKEVSEKIKKAIAYVPVSEAPQRPHNLDQLPLIERMEVSARYMEALNKYLASSSQAQEVTGKPAEIRKRILAEEPQSKLNALEVVIDTEVRPLVGVFGRIERSAGEVLGNPDLEYLHNDVLNIYDRALTDTDNELLPKAKIGLESSLKRRKEEFLTLKKMFEDQEINENQYLDCVRSLLNPAEKGQKGAELPKRQVMIDIENNAVLVDGDEIKFTDIGIAFLAALIDHGPEGADSVVLKKEMDKFLAERNLTSKSDVSQRYQTFIRKCQETTSPIIIRSGEYKEVGGRKYPIFVFAPDVQILPNQQAETPQH